jgi:hypothetical protein
LARHSHWAAMDPGLVRSAQINEALLQHSNKK